MNQKASTLHYIKHYDSLTRVTRLKIAVEMAGPTCILETIPCKFNIKTTSMFKFKMSKLTS